MALTRNVRVCDNNVDIIYLTDEMLQIFAKFEKHGLYLNIVSPLLKC